MGVYIWIHTCAYGQDKIPAILVVIDQSRATESVSVWDRGAAWQGFTFVISLPLSEELPGLENPCHVIVITLPGLEKKSPHVTMLKSSFVYLISIL